MSTLVELSIADLIFGQVLCIQHAKLETMLSVLSRRLNIVDAEGFSIDQGMAYVPGQEIAAQRKGVVAAGGGQGWQDVGHGVAVLPVSGSLVSRSRGLDTMSGLQSYRQIGNDFQALMADNSVQHIVMHIDSPGGSVNSLPDLVDQITAARGVKPVTALVDDNAYSAAYWLAAAADEVVVSRTSGTGSIGALAVHVDRSAANERNGVKVTAIASGERKAMLSPDAPLSDMAREQLQAMVDEMGTMFIDGVAQLRGLSAKKVRDMQAGIFQGAQGVDQGLADRVMSANDALREIVSRYQPNRQPSSSDSKSGRVQRAAQAMAIRMA
jgi:signal peptide peptidase SppA